MSLSGNLRTMVLPEILQWISTGRKTGTLHLERRSIQKKIIFKDGSIFTSWSNDPRESLGQFLMRERRIHLARKPLGYVGSAVVGVAFGAAWTPCIGPILGAILTLAAEAARSEERRVGKEC